MTERAKRDKIPVVSWVENGFLTATEGNCVDYEIVEADIRQSAQINDLRVLGPDQWNSRMLTQRLMTDNVNVVEVPQSMAGMSPAMKEIERLLRSGQMYHAHNPCARWCFGNTRCAVDGNENIKPMKDRSTGRIDVTVAWINAMAVAMAEEKLDVNEAILADDWSM